MKGLFVKDLMLIKNQKRTLPLLLLCGAVMSFSMQPISSVIYLTILGTMLCAGTISYDELDHGFSFLFTLPVTRRKYVREKYLFSVLCCLVCMLIGVVISLIVSTAKGMALPLSADSLISSACGSFFAAALMLGTLIPARIKYGSEKSSIVLFILFGLAAAVVLTISKGRDFLPKSFVTFVTKILANANNAVMLACVLLLSLLILGISEQITERIILRKEY